MLAPSAQGGAYRRSAIRNRSSEWSITWPRWPFRALIVLGGGAGALAYLMLVGTEARRYAETGDAGLIWEGHRAGMERANCHIETLAKLDQLPATGFEVACFPFKIKAASAGFTRAVAIFED